MRWNVNEGSLLDAPRNARGAVVPVADMGGEEQRETFEYLSRAIDEDRASEAISLLRPPTPAAAFR